MPLLEIAASVSAVSSIANVFGSLSSGNAAERAAAENAQITLNNAFANAADIREIGQLNSDIVSAVSGLNAQAVVDIAEHNADQVLKTSKINAFFTWFGAEYNASVADYNSEIAHNNSEVAANNAALAREQGLYNAARIQEQNQRIMGEQRAGFAKSGVVVDQGSSYSVMYDTAIQNAREELLAKHTSDIIAYSFLLESINHFNQGRFLTSQAKAIRVQGSLESAYTLYKGKLEAESILFQGYTQANIILSEGALQSALIEFSAEKDAINTERVGSSIAAQLITGGEITSQQANFNALSAALSGTGNLFRDIGNIQQSRS